MALVWGKTDAAYLQCGYTEDGQLMAQIHGGAGSYSVWIHPDGCGRQGGVALSGFPSREATQAEVERIVAEVQAGRDPGL